MMLLLATLLAVYAVTRPARAPQPAPTPAAPAAAVLSIEDYRARSRMPIGSPGAKTPRRVPQFGDAGFGVSELFGGRQAA